MEIGIWIPAEGEKASLAEWTRQCEHRVVMLHSTSHVKECLNQRQVQLMIASDQAISFDEVRQWRERVPEIDWILVTETPSFAWAEKAMLAGAVGFCALPVTSQQLDEIIHHVRIQRYYRLQAMLGGEASSRTIDLSKPIESALAYIAEHISEHLTLPGVSREVYLSPSHFSRLFTQKVGIPFNEYLLVRRIDAAKTLLTETHLPIEFIATKVGIGSASHFSQTFKRVTGTTPRAYRYSSQELPLSIRG